MSKFERKVSSSSMFFKCTLASNCGEEFTNDGGSLMSRNYPNNYPNNEDCVWLIKATKDHRVQLTIEGTNLNQNRVLYIDFILK